ncbi:MAG TPA: hypothetical protein VHN36_12950 [Ilumatobacteraceae bacterium]|nr:hypothetical protein [Ilumatobacteraceae bacterium]
MRTIVESFDAEPVGHSTATDHVTLVIEQTQLEKRRRRLGNIVEQRKPLRGMFASERSSS